jgi:hypothetical protein
MLTIVKKNDSYDAITYQLENEDNSTVDLTGASVNFVMGKKNKLITNAKATVTSATSGIVSYQLTQLDTLVSGTFLAEFVVTFANGTVKTYPSNGYITVDVEQNLDTSQANVVVDMIAEKQGDFTSKLNSILQQAGNINMSAMNEYSWTATEGQLVFTFPSSVNYTPSTKWFQVSVGNVPVDNTLVNRSYDNQFALNIDSSNIKAGMTVRAMWVEPITPVVPNSYKIIPQQNLPPVDAGEGDLWFDTSDNTYQGTVFDDLNTKVTNNTTALADIATNVKSQGVKGDGITDDTTAFNNLINYVSGLGGGTILIPANTTILLNTKDSRKVMLKLKSNVNIIGNGYTSVIKLADGIVQSGGFLMLSNLDNASNEASTPLKNVILSNFLIDCNGVGNQLGSTQNQPYSVPIFIPTGDNITVQSVYIKDNTGMQCIGLGSNISTPTVTNVKIINNLFTNVANDPKAVDHSVIYSMVDGGVITGNIMVNPSTNTVARNVSTGLEIHGRNTIVSDNIVINFRTGSNVVATVQDSFNNRFSDNTFENVNNGFALWQYDPYKLKNVSIHHNTIRLKPNDNLATDDGCTAFISVSTGVGYDTLKINNNIIEGISLPTTTQAQRGLQFLCPVKNTDITNNKFTNIGYEAISLLNSLTNVIINNNTVVDAVKKDNTGGGTYKNSVIYCGVVNPNSVSNLSIKDNKINNSSGFTSYGVCVVADGDSVEVKNNKVNTATTRKESLTTTIGLTNISREFDYSTTITVPAIANGATSIFDVTIPESLAGSFVAVNSPSNLAGFLVTATVAVNGTVRLSITNNTGFNSNLGNTTFNFRLFS